MMKTIDAKTLEEFKPLNIYYHLSVSRVLSLTGQSPFGLLKYYTPRGKDQPVYAFINRDDGMYLGAVIPKKVLFSKRGRENYDT